MSHEDRAQPLDLNHGSESERRVAGERTPLIPPPEPLESREASTDGEPISNGFTEHPPAQEEEDVPLPKLQIFLLSYARMVEPVAFFSIFPFVNQMIFETGAVKEADVGFWSGLMESLFSLTQTIVMLAWGKAADRWGRKPVLVFSLCGISVAVALFGFCKTIWQMILARCFAGVFAGTVVTVRAMFSENSTKKTQARAFSFFAFASNTGIFIGPLLGGNLQHPAESFPNVFGNVALFKKYPFALPTMVTGFFALSAAITCGLFIKETLKPKDDREEDEPPMSMLQILKAPGVARVLGIYSEIFLIVLGSAAVMPVFWFTTIKLGGYSWSPNMISIFLGAGGGSQALWLLLVFPYLQRSMGTGGVLRACGWIWPFFLAASPLGNLLLRNHWKVAFWSILPACHVFGSGVAMSFTAIQLCINDISPSGSSFGLLNSIALSLVSGLRAFAPVVFTSIFAIGVRSQVLGGQLIWVLLVAMAILFRFSLKWLPEEAEGRPQKRSSRVD
ncbi:MFS transporter [Rhizodiscina lignyota]|uniref:MFS transporter n=1 Tax=Rhizodiscina lignyota TaxID=1504668 RepID=A0A9P4I3G5_9PEZI|nr:MFS transporter [Rhizodiscina lignyota]